MLLQTILASVTLMSITHTLQKACSIPCRLLHTHGYSTVHLSSYLHVYLCFFIGGTFFLSAMINYCSCCFIVLLALRTSKWRWSRYTLRRIRIDIGHIARNAFVTAPSIGKNKHFHVFMFEAAANLRVGNWGGGDFFTKSGETA